MSAPLQQDDGSRRGSPGAEGPIGPARVPGRPGMGGRAAAIVLALQGLAMLCFVGFYLVALSHGASSDPVRVVMSVVFIGVFAVAVTLLARGLWRGSAWARTPTVVWNALLLPVAWGMFQSGRADLGSVVLVAALLAICGIVLEVGREAPLD